MSGWAKRVYQKFSALTDDASVQNLPTDMVKIFASMEMITVTELKNLRENVDNRVEPDDAFVDLDFATEDFINKNKHQLFQKQPTAEDLVAYIKYHHYITHHTRPSDSAKNEILKIQMENEMVSMVSDDTSTILKKKEEIIRKVKLVQTEI